MVMLNVLKTLLKQINNDIDSGNSNISEKEQEEVIDLIRTILSEDVSKIDAADIIGVSRATFDNYIKKGLLPEGKHRRGFKELSWNKHILNKFKKCQK